MNRNARAGIKNAAGLTAATKNELHKKAYPEPSQLSSTKDKFLIEIRGLLGSLDNPFLSQAEQKACKVILFSTLRKLTVLQNGYCSGCGYVESTNSELPD